MLRGPRITVSCECGAREQLDYAQRWTCEGCGRTYDTAQIPADEYAQVRRTQLRYRLLPIVLGLVVLALAVLFSLTGNIVNVFILLPLALMAWFVFLRPAHRRRYRKAIANLPRWDLRADGG